MNAQAAVAFFTANAGYARSPGESVAQAKRRCARKLAAAERWAAKRGIGFAWSVDPDCTSSEWCAERPAWQQWQCVARNKRGVIVASLHGIDFGRDGGPCGDAYSRVVEAELAQEARAR